MNKKNITLGAVALSLAMLPMVTFAQGNAPKQAKPTTAAKTLTVASTTKASTTKPVVNKEALTPEAIACIQTALSKRDDAISASFTTYSTAVTGALTTRKVALNDSWSKPTGKDRLAARDAAWNAYKKTVKEANTKMMTAKKAAHDAFGKEAKACKVSVSGEEKRADLI